LIALFSDLSVNAHYAAVSMIQNGHLKNNAALVEQAVFNQLEPLVFVEAAKAATTGAVAELQRLVQNMAAAVDQPTELFRLSWRLYRHIAEMGVNTVLTSIYTTLLTFLEQETWHLNRQPTCAHTTRWSSQPALTAATRARAPTVPQWWSTKSVRSSYPNSRMT
jgi:DNA-binding FadR family transcriptional regulator